MPAPQSSMMQQLARTKFSSFGITVPQNWTTPSGDQYSNAFKPEELSTSPVAGAALVRAATANKYHTDTQKMHHAKIGAFLDGATSAICSAWSTWQSSATMTGVVVAANTATGGQVVGPPLTPLILASAPKATPQEAKYSQAIASVIGSAWAQYTATIKVPGLPWYPAFTAFPGPMAPPIPNIPSPVIALTQSTAPVSVGAMKGQMVGALGDPTAPFHAELFEAVCDSFDKCFKVWQASTMVTNVLGTGPIPTFAPPAVPVGPVVGGTGNMVPGGFA